MARVALGVPRGSFGTPSVTDQLLDGFATRMAVGYAAVPLLRGAVEGLFTDETRAASIPATILGWFAADDLWDDRGRLVMLGRAEVIERRRGALGALRVILAGLSSSELRAARPDEAEAYYQEAAEISSADPANPRTATAAALKSSTIVPNTTLKIYPGTPHGLTGAHEQEFNRDLLAVITS